MPKLTPQWAEHNPGPDPRAGDDCGPYAAWEIADEMGFTTLGVSFERLPPGSRSSLRHSHAVQDEAVYVVSGTLVLVEDEETVLRAGDVAAWKAGAGPAHCLENRGTEDAVILVTGARGQPDTVTYPDHDLKLDRDADGTAHYSRLDGTPVDGDG